MSKFEEFKEAFDARFEEGIYEFIDLTEYGDKEIPFGGELIDDLDEVEYDSYGSEDSSLERIFYFKDFDIFISFEGTRQSYSGEDWDTFKEVKKGVKTVEYWDKVN